MVSGKKKKTVHTTEGNHCCQSFLKLHKSDTSESNIAMTATYEGHINVMVVLSVSRLLYKTNVQN
jgi:hypothetical protein